MARLIVILREAFDEGVYVAGLSATAFCGALLAEGALVLLLGQ